MLNVIYNKHETPNFGFSIKGMRNEPDNGANQRLCLDAPIPFRSWVYFNKWRCLENWISVSLHQGLNPIWKLLSQWLISLNGEMSNIHSGYLWEENVLDIDIYIQILMGVINVQLDGVDGCSCVLTYLVSQVGGDILHNSIYSWQTSARLGYNNNYHYCF